MNQWIFFALTALFWAGICQVGEGGHAREYDRSLLSRNSGQAQSVAQKNLLEGQAFLALNSQKDSVITLPSGLQYQVLREGKGAPPGPHDTVTVHYRGELIDGREFDSSYQRGAPAKFQVNRVIKGWQEALQMMRPGARYKLFIPPELAYGDRGAGGKIGPNSTLVFEVNLLSVEGRSAAPEKADKQWPETF